MSGEAFAVPGVVAIFDAGDIVGDFKPAIPTSRMKGYYATPFRPLAEGKVRYVGEPVVAVVAESRYAAEDALELISIDYEPLPVAVSKDEAAVDDAPLLHDEAGTNVIISRTFARGDVDAAIAAAAVVVKGRFRMTRKTPMPMETRSYLAEWDRRRQALTLHSSTNIPGIICDVLGACLDLPGNRVRVVAPDVGGSFGGKGSLNHEEMLVCVLARKLERPVKFVADRMEDLTAMSQAFDETIEAELAVDADGRLLGLRADVIGDIGAYSIYPWTGALEPVQVVSFLPGPYRMEHYRGRVRGVLTPKPPTGPYRGVGRPSSTFAMERLMDMAARRLRMDPAEIRRRNLVTAEEFPYRTGSGIIWDRSAFQECLQGVCELVDYPALLRQRDAARAEGRWVGIGLRKLCRADGHRLAHRRRAGHAHQHRHGDRLHPHRCHRCRDGRVRHLLPRPGAGDDARPGGRRRAGLPHGGHRDPARRQRPRAHGHRHLCQPFGRTRRRRRYQDRTRGEGKGAEGRRLPHGRAGGRP